MIPAAIIICSFGLAYVLMLVVLTEAWYNPGCDVKLKRQQYNVKVSIVVPVRNEENNILNCLKHLVLQDYPFENLEIIIVDDHSVDETFKVSEGFALQNPGVHIRILQLPTDRMGKKQALQFGIEHTGGKLILTCDADCICGTTWVNTIVAAYHENQTAMLIGPVRFSGMNNFIERLFALEFLSLVGSGMAAARAGMPIFCNGANLAFDKEAFLKVNAYNGNLQYASGDDVFLLHKFKKHYPGMISVVKDRKAIVDTKAPHSFLDFVNQRLRWASKSKGYRDTAVIVIAFIVMLFNTGVITAGILTFFNSMWLWFFAGLLITKIMVDFPLLVGICKFSRQSNLLWYYLPLQLLYIPYIVMIGVLSLFGKFSWKGRQY